MESISPGIWLVEYEGGEYFSRYLGGRVRGWRVFHQVLWVVEYEGGEYSPRYLGDRVGGWRVFSQVLGW